MNVLNDTAYYLRREQQERDLAVRAVDEGVRLVHLQMADRYAALAIDVETRPTLTLVVAPRQQS